MSKSTHGSQAISKAHRRLEQIKERHKQEMIEEVEVGDSIGVAINTNSRHPLIVDICEEVQHFFPKAEPIKVEQYRSLVLSIDAVRQSADLRNSLGNPLGVMERVAIEYREEALALIENRLEVSEPTEEGDVDVLYLRDPVSKMQKTIAVGGFSLGEDMRVLENHIKMFSEQVLCDPIPDRTPRV